MAHPSYQNKIRYPINNPLRFIALPMFMPNFVNHHYLEEYCHAIV